MDGRLKTAAEQGNIDMLYGLIREHPKVLDDIDEVPFIETPLHVAASGGKISFAMEIVRLKASFSRKLNEDGFSPMHLALFNGQNKMVLRFVDHERDLVRVQGREGKTPVHHVAELGDVDLLAEFLWACPTSIEDVTVHGETALHIDVKNSKVEALDVLLGGLLTACSNIHKKSIIINRKDVQGKTALHIAVATNQVQAGRLLVKSGTDVNVKDDEGKTALDFLNPQNSREVAEILLRAKSCLRWFSNRHVDGQKHCLMSNLSFKDRLQIYIFRSRKYMDNHTRNVILVVATLILTATYQASLSPPGGLWQENSKSNNSNTNIHYNNYNDGGSSASESKTHIAGTIIMSNFRFFAFYTINSLTLLATTLVIFFLLPRDRTSGLLFFPLYLFYCCYEISWRTISPSHASNYVLVIWILTNSVAFFCLFLLSKYYRKFDQTTTS